MKNRRLEIRLTEDELYKIDSKAQKLRMSRSKFLLQSALHQKIITLDNTAMKQLISELRKIGININHIAILVQYGKVAMCTYRGYEKRNYKGMGRIEKIATGSKKT